MPAGGVEERLDPLEHRRRELREPVDEFFENVMVNAEDKDVRINRLTLLSKLRELFLQVADISLLQ